MAPQLGKGNRAAAIGSRTELGQAQGILMERFGIDAEHAFGLLRHHSNVTNTKLRHVAQTVIATRALPDIHQTG